MRVSRKKDAAVGRFRGLRSSVVLVALPLLIPLAYPVAHPFVFIFGLLVAVVLVPVGIANSELELCLNLSFPSQVY